MNRRQTLPILLALLALAAVAAPASAAPAGNPFKLKAGAKGKACLACHTDFAATTQKAFVHTPVKNGDCSDCHDPHASDHGKLLAAAPDAICQSCHADVVPAKSQSVHPDVIAGNCVKCHDPHASANKGNLLQAGNDLCQSCHKELTDHIAQAKFKHSPVTKSCLSCHDPHAGGTTRALLKKAAPELCVACHKPENPVFQKAHLGYPVAKADCVSCHDPHGSSDGSLLWASVHMPVKNKMCAQCHYDAGAPNALETKKQRIDLCKACHSDLVNTTLTQSRVHWAVLDQTACLNCHRPHAAPKAKLLKADEKELCGSCHADAVARQQRSVTKHPPIENGECSSCHRPHASNAVFLLDGKDELEVCAKCHDWGKHSTHPIGEKVVDPRNKNLTTSCSSCHRTHGSEFKHLAHFDMKKDMCLQCHDK